MLPGWQEKLCLAAARTSPTSSLPPGPHGKIDVIIDGEVIAEHRHEPNAHIFPDIENLMKAIAQRAD